jgi:3-(methylthio)propanoyl-CoA dehydrogenase
MTYRASTKDIRFCLEHVTDVHTFYQSEAFPDFDKDVCDAVLEAAGTLAQDILAPLNSVGDNHPARLENGVVVTSPGFDAAIKAFGDGGWHSLASEPEFGGQGLPKALEQACFDMFHAANMAFTLMPTLSQGAIEAIHAHGDARQKALYLPKMIAGDWTGTMNLTEPQAGSDLSVLTTKAEKDGDGYRLFGQKIYITWGDHPQPENIIHLVLARLPDAPSGTKGISLFICPKYEIDADGKPGARNLVKVGGLEHKLGIHASPTCVMLFEGAKAELIGKPNEGLAAMFIMMNAARLAVGFEGVGIADAAFQKALAYALDRKQGRSVLTGQNNAPIYDHPDVRLTLGLMKARLDAARGLCLATAYAADVARNNKDPDIQARAKRREDFFVPIAKAWSTDMGVEVASHGLQIHGGMGYIEETGAAQFYRDARIAPIYEGTNGIQAADLVGRKLGTDGKAAFDLQEDIELYIKNSGVDKIFKPESEVLGSTVKAFSAATHWLLGQKTSASADVATGASAYLKLCGDMIGGYMLLKLAMAAHKLIEDGHADVDWLQAKIALMQLYAAHILSRAPALYTAITSGSTTLNTLKANAFC